MCMMHLLAMTMHFAMATGLTIAWTQHKALRYVLGTAAEWEIQSGQVCLSLG